MRKANLIQVKLDLSDCCKPLLCLGATVLPAHAVTSPIIPCWHRILARCASSSWCHGIPLVHHGQVAEQIDGIAILIVLVAPPCLSSSLQSGIQLITVVTRCSSSFRFQHAKRHSQAFPGQMIQTGKGRCLTLAALACSARARVSGEASG